MRFVKEAFESNYIAPLGPQVDAFEREFAEYVGIKHCVAVSSGTAAMHLALRILGVGQGDEVFASTLTFIGSVTPVVFQGAELMFVDCDRASWNMDPDLLRKALEDCKRRGKLPKAVVPTDLYGQCVDYERIFEICEEYGVPVVADAAGIQTNIDGYSGTLTTNNTVLYTAFNTNTSKAEVWYDGDVDAAGGAVLMATLDDVTTLTLLQNNFDTTDFTITV